MPNEPLEILFIINVHVTPSLLPLGGAIHIVSPKDPPTPQRGARRRRCFTPVKQDHHATVFNRMPLDLMIRPVARIVRELPPSHRRTVYPFLPRPQDEVLLTCGVRLCRDNKKAVYYCIR